MEDLEGVDPGFWKAKRVFVTGANGIVGSWVVKALLKRSAEIVALIYKDQLDSELTRSRDIDKVTTVAGELQDISRLATILAEYRIDTVFHIGAQAIVATAYEQPLQTFEANIRGTYNVLEACRFHGQHVKRIVVASSDKAYGAQPRLPYTEDMPLTGRFPYEVSKSCTDLLAQSYFHSYALPVGIIRCGNIFGGGDLNWSRIVPGTIRSCLRDEAPIIRSDGTFVRDYVYVKDVALAYVSLAEALSDRAFHGESFNVASGCRISVLDLTDRIQRIMGCLHLEPVILNETVGEIRDQYLSTDKAKRMLGWQPRYDLDSGLSETVAWYHDFFR